MSCYHDPQVKNDIKNFLTELNTLLRKRDFYIDFVNGTLHHNYKGFCGALEDERTLIYLLDDNTGTVIHQTEDYKHVNK